MFQWLKFLGVFLVVISLGLWIPTGVDAKQGKGKGASKKAEKWEAKAEKKADKAEKKVKEETEEAEEAVEEAEEAAEEAEEEAEEEVAEVEEADLEDEIDLPKGLAKKDKTPAGWSQGEKKGWGDSDLPPGLSKK